MWYLIKENLLNLAQRLASFYIMYDMYSSDQVQTTPFIPLLLESLESSQNNIEKKALIDILEFKFTASKMTIEEFISQNKNIEEVLISFMESNTGRMVYDDSTKLWWDGPVAVAQEYKAEMGLAG